MNEMYLISKNANKIFDGKYTNFLDSKREMLVKGILKKHPYKIYKPYKDSEKVILYSNKEPEVVLYEIVSNTILKHQDILGTIFSLNIDETLFGDIVIDKNKYYIYMLKEVENYFISNFIKVKNSNVILNKLDLEFLENYERKYETLEFIVSSNRLDTIVSHIIRTNRRDVTEKIKNKEILVNYDYPKTSYVLKENDIFSIRKYGKYKFIGVVNTTKKENIVIRLYKYI